MNHTVTYLSFIKQISNKLIAAGCFDRKWMEKQRPRLVMMWNAGETVDSAFETISIFAKAQLGSGAIKHLNPMIAPICTKYTEVTGFIK